MMQKISKEELAARLEARDWLYRAEVIDLSDYAGCDLT